MENKKYKSVICIICKKEFKVNEKAISTCPESKGWVCDKCCKYGKCESCR